MLQPFRERFNHQQFSSQRYEALLDALDLRMRGPVAFRVAETPCFFSEESLNELVEVGRKLTKQLLGNAAYEKDSEAIIPERYRVPHDTLRPNFMTVDFGFVQAANGALQPKLVELQAFPSLFGYQDVLCEEYQRAFGLDANLDWHLGSLTKDDYWSVLGKTIVGDQDPENVVLLELEPERQKTLCDFQVYADRLGVVTADITKLRKEGSRLFYLRAGRWVPIHRIFNRTIVEELERKNVQPAFDFRDDLKVEWAGQPNWFFWISKFSLPYLNDASVPTAVFLDDWIDGRRGLLPEDRTQLLLKPLFSFAGAGIKFAPEDALLNAIPKADRRNYLMQERMHFAPIISTPHGPTQAEVRVMYCWPDQDAEMTAMTTLVRLGRGLMMGVDHNRNQQWVGGSAAFFPRNRPT